MEANKQASSVASSPGFSGDESGPSLAEMAQRDLDAALQLLSDRAQYITGAAGAAIALRRSGKNDMLCRASSGSSAPELGMLLSAEHGLSGESVRSRQPLRCDDTQHDTRVNRDVCRQMGIASVMVMPLVVDDEVFGVFELFSGKERAFGERETAALRRLSEMVGTAVKLARAAEELHDRLQQAPEEGSGTEVLEIPGMATGVPVPEPVEKIIATPQSAAPAAPQSAAVKKPASMPVFWSAMETPAAEPQKPPDVDQSHVPPVLRSLHKCEVCGFPVSAGRVLCVECEEKKWRGQLHR